LAHAAREGEISVDRIPELLHSARQWRGDVLDLVKRVQLGTGEIALTLNLAQLTGEEMHVRYVVPVHIKRRGVEMRIVHDGVRHGLATSPDPALIKAVIRAQRWFEDLVSNRRQSVTEIAKAED